LELQTWLEWAGQRLIAMPGSRVGPKDSGIAWPDYAQDPYEVLQFRVGIALRIAAPAANEIGLMEEILLLPGLIGTNEDKFSCKLRWIVRRRTLLHPITNRRLWPWSRLAKEYKSSQYNVRLWYGSGLSQICRRLPDEQAESVRERFDLNVLVA
jgi:hypothetical protein